MSWMCSLFCFSELKSLIIRYDKMVSHMMPHVHCLGMEGSLSSHVTVG